MARVILLLRGVNLGPRRRVGMPELREALGEVGFGDVRTYVQSGNIVASTRSSPKTAADRCRELIAERFALEVPVVVRTRDELAAVVKSDPLGEVATDPKRYQVTFLDGRLKAPAIKRLAEAAAEQERFEVVGREVYAWHPRGVARSKLWALLAGPELGVTATSRNWTTVTKLLEMADGP